MPVPTEQDALRILQALFEKTVLPAYRGTPERDRAPGLFDSKLGGLPYWDPTQAYPVDKAGNKLVLLTQIDLAAIPSRGELPQEGLLQFFIGGEDEDYGCGFDEPGSGEPGSFRVVWHRTVDRSVTPEAVRALEIPTSLTGACSPVKGEIALSFESPGSEPISIGDYRLETAIKETAAAFGIELPIFFSVDNLLELLPEGTEERWSGVGRGMKLLGYPSFTQFDPRSKGTRYDRLLLQIDSMRDLRWGDCGIANFFINAEALKRWDLSDVWYYWHCG